MRSFWQADSASLFFKPEQLVKRRELARVLARLCRSLSGTKDWTAVAKPAYAAKPSTKKTGTYSPKTQAIKRLMKIDKMK